MNLSQNFTLEELTRTSTGLPNMPGPMELQNLQMLVNNVLQPLRNFCGRPIRINSGYRSVMVNQAVHGSPISQHCFGMAADIDSENNAHLFNLIRHNLPFDQLIWESGNDIQPDWVHVSFNAAGNRGEVLRMLNGNYMHI